MTFDTGQHAKAQFGPYLDNDGSEDRSRRARITDSPMMSGIRDVTMVAIVGGGPRLAVRAAKMMIEEEYASRSSAHDRTHSRLRRRSR